MTRTALSRINCLQAVCLPGDAAFPASARKA